MASNKKQSIWAEKTTIRENCNRIQLKLKSVNQISTVRSGNILQCISISSLIDHLVPNEARWKINTVSKKTANTIKLKKYYQTIHFKFPHTIYHEIKSALKTPKMQWTN